MNVENFKTDKPQPVNTLLKEAEKRNLSLLQARLSQDLAREQIRQAQDGHLPTLDLTASTGISDTSYSGSKTRGAAGTQYDDSNMGQNKVGLSFSLPIYQGGMVNSQVKQAQYNFVGASEQLESAHRSVVQTVRSSFNNINASISSINAYKQAVVSAQSSLDAMEAGYSVGTRTIVDVLDATTTLYNAKQELANARYNYLINQLNIKSALGTLNEQDLLALNNALSKPVSTNPENVAPQTPEQNAIADGYAPDSPAPVVQQTSARTTTSNGHNLSVTDDDDGASAPSKRKANVKIRVICRILFPFSLQFRPAILYSDGYLPLVPEDKKMKRTKSIRHASFRKNWSARHLTPVALAVATVFMLAGCEKSDETVSLYQNADDCSAANPGKSAECTTAYNNALKEAERTAPKYATREDCVAEFGEGQCQQAPAQAGMAPENQAQAQQSSGSFWMPLMAGYMMGRLMGGGAGFAQQPLFSSKNPASPAYGKYTDATGKNYGAAQPGRTMTVPKTAMAPKPATTTTVTRGGFGESVAKQSTMQRSATGTSSRSMGG